MKSNRDVIHDKQKRGWSDRDIERNQWNNHDIHWCCDFGILSFRPFGPDDEAAGLQASLLSPSAPWNAPGWRPVALPLGSKTYQKSSKKQWPRRGSNTIWTSKSPKYRNSSTYLGCDCNSIFPFCIPDYDLNFWTDMRVLLHICQSSPLTPMNSKFACSWFCQVVCTWNMIWQITFCSILQNHEFAVMILPSSVNLHCDLVNHNFTQCFWIMESKKFKIMFLHLVRFNQQVNQHTTSSHESTHSWNK